MEIHGEDPRCAIHGYASKWSLENRTIEDWQEEAISLLSEIDAEPNTRIASAGGDGGLREAVGRFRELFAHALETPGYGTDHESREEIDAHFREIDRHLASSPATDASNADDVVEGYANEVAPVAVEGGEGGR
jgi:diacylglycerol kinase family enzyme